MVWEKMWFDDFQDALVAENDFSNSESLCHCGPSSFSSIQLTVREEMSFE